MSNLTVTYPKRVIKAIKNNIVNREFTTVTNNFKTIKSSLNLSGINGIK